MSRECFVFEVYTPQKLKALGFLSLLLLVQFLSCHVRNAQLALAIHELHVLEA
jgi:hypothetical protein